MPDSDQYSHDTHDTSLEHRIHWLEQKTDRLIALLFAYVRRATGSEKKHNGDIDRLLQRALGYPVPDDSETEPQVRVFQVDVDNKGQFKFQPKEQWEYPVGSRVQWVSSTGSITVSLDPDYSRDLGSPFEGRQEIQSKRVGAKKWETDVLKVRSLFSPTERLARRLADVPRVYHTFTISIAKGDKLFVNRERNGGSC